MRYATILFAATVIAVATVPASAQRGSSPFSEFHKQAELAIGKPAPALHLQDTDGVEHNLRDYLGRYVFVEFGSYT